MDDPLKFTLMEAFRAAAKEYFGQLAIDCRTSLQKVMSNVYGFETAVAIVTIAVYHGHRPAIMAKIRNRTPSDHVYVDDSRDIAASWFVERETGQTARGMPEYDGWTEQTIDEAVQQEASALRTHAWAYLNDKTADWDGMRQWREVQIAKNMARR